MDDGADSHPDISAVVNDYRDVARAHAHGGLAGGVGSLHHTGAASGQDDVRVPHDLVGQLQGGGVDPADDVRGCAGLDGGVQNDPGGLDGAALGPGVGGEDDGVAGLQGDEGLEDGGGGGVGGGDDGGDEAHGLGDLLEAEGLVLLDDPAGLHVLIGVVDVLGGVVVLDDLVLHHAHARLRNGHLGQRNTLAVGSLGGFEEDAVHLLLGEGGEGALRLTHGVHLGGKGLGGVDQSGNVVISHM